MDVIGLSGYSRSGKNTVADILTEFGYEQVAFADLLREGLYRLNPVIPAFDDFRRLRDVVDTWGWDRTKVWVPEVRDLLQRLGTEFGRDLIHENVWVDTLLRQLNPEGRYVISDVRFPNEANAVHDRGGLVIRVNRPGTQSVNGHASDSALDDYSLFDAVIVNDGSVDDLRNKVMHLQVLRVATELGIEPAR